MPADASVAVPGCLFPAVLVASAHGLADARLPSRRLGLYALVLCELPACADAVLLAASSVVHFARDVGLGASAAMHAAWLLTWLVSARAAWCAFAVFYCAFHAPSALAPPLARAVHVGVLAALAVPASDVNAPSWLARGIAVHAWINLRPLTRPRAGTASRRAPSACRSPARASSRRRAAPPPRRAPPATRPARA